MVTKARAALTVLLVTLMSVAWMGSAAASQPSPYIAEVPRREVLKVTGAQWGPEELGRGLERLRLTVEVPNGCYGRPYLSKQLNGEKVVVEVRAIKRSTFCHQVVTQSTITLNVRGGFGREVVDAGSGEAVKTLTLMY